jgi:hypothetical protein
MCVKETGYEAVDCCNLTQDREKWRGLVNSYGLSVSIKREECLG